MDFSGSGAILQTVGPAFSSSRVLRFSELSQEEQDSFVRFFAEQKVQFFRDIDGQYVANVRLYDPNVIDLSASGTRSSTRVAKVSESMAGGRVRASDSCWRSTSRCH